MTQNTGTLEQLLKEIKLLNQNLRVTNTELSTVDPTIKNEVVKEALQTQEAIKTEPKTEAVAPVKSSVTVDEIKAQAAIFIKGGTENKEALKAKIREYGVKRISEIPESEYETVLAFLKG